MTDIPGPDLSALHELWDEIAPLPAKPAAREQTPAQIAREMRLRALAARQVEESRAARGVI